LEGDGQPGLKVRVDRWEQNDERKKWQVKALIGALLTIIGYTVKEIIVRL
jgi:hypothetical protein